MKKIKKTFTFEDDLLVRKRVRRKMLLKVNTKTKIFDCKKKQPKYVKEWIEEY